MKHCFQIPNSKSKLIIRVYNFDKDIINVHNLHKSVFHYSKEKIPTVQELMHLKGWVMYSYYNGCECECEYEIVGYLLYSMNTINTSVYLEYIGVNPKYQGIGIGQTLINIFVEYLDEYNYCSSLDVEENTDFTDTLLKWYAKYGYTIVNSRLSSDDPVYLTLMVRLPNKL